MLFSCAGRGPEAARSSSSSLKLGLLPLYGELVVCQLILETATKSRRFQMMDKQMHRRFKMSHENIKFSTNPKILGRRQSNKGHIRSQDAK